MSATQNKVADPDLAVVTLTHVGSLAKFRLLTAFTAYIWQDLKAAPAELAISRGSGGILDCPVPPETAI